MHNIINHRLNFVDSIMGINTQTIELCWNKIKYLIKRKMGILGDKKDVYITEYMLKKMKNIFYSLNLIKMAFF